MAAYSSHNFLRQMALLAGYSLLLMALLAGFAYGYVFEKLYHPENPAATLASIQQVPLLLRLFVFCFVLILFLDVLVAWALYNFFATTNQTLSQLTAWLRLIYATLLGLALSSVVGIWAESDGNPQQALHVAAHFETFLSMWSLGLIVFGCHLAGLSWLMFRTRRMARWLACLMLVAAICYVVTNGAALLLPNYSQYKQLVDQLLALPMALGELGLAIWLIARAGRSYSST
ncbi:DUF4386 domain-containing protein [Spirosoma daeguense]